MTTGTILYQNLADQLRQEIAGGRFQSGQMLASEHDLARQRNLSRVTVRKASDLLIGEGLIERRPGKGLFVRQGGGGGRIGQIQVVCGNLAWAPSIHATRAVQAAARAHGIQVQIYDAHGSMDSDIEMIRGLPDSPACGAIIMALHAPAFAEALYGLKARDFPCVLIDQRLHDLDVPSVMADNHAGGYQAAQLLLEAGHRRIAFVGDLEADTVQQRLAGLRDAVGDAGLPFDRTLVSDVRPADRLAAWTPLIAARVREIMTRKAAPTAIFASCDAIARDICATLRGLGLTVPADVSVIGFDDDPLADGMAPGLTTVRQCFADMGGAAFALLHRRILDPTAAVEHRLIPVELVERGSVTAPAIT